MQQKNTTFASILLAAGCAALLAACGSSQSAPPPQPQPVPGNAAVGGEEDLLAQCVSVFTRQYDCTDQFIPMLVDARIKADLPAGIAAEGATEEGRNGLYETAKQEWAVDGAEPKRTQTCEAIVSSPRAEDQENAKKAAECLSHADCDAFVACIAPLYDAHFSAAKARMSGQQ